MRIFLILLISLVSMECFSQENIIVDFSNEFLLNGEKGQMIVVDSCDTANYAVIHWENGFYATGTINNNLPIGKWYLYDKKNNLREYLIIGYDAKCILYSKKMNKKGEIISEFKAITPCF